MRPLIAGVMLGLFTAMPAAAHAPQPVAEPTEAFTPCNGLPVHRHLSQVLQTPGQAPGALIAPEALRALGVTMREDPAPAG